MTSADEIKKDLKYWKRTFKKGIKFMEKLENIIADAEIEEKQLSFDWEKKENVSKR